MFGAGKSATVLIDYLIENAVTNLWTVIIADADKAQILLKTKHSPAAEAVEVDITNNEQRSALIKKADIVISLMPPSLHFLIAKDCVDFSKNLLTASYVDDNIKSLQHEIEQKKLLFICEMGLDPGIDHMSAMQLIDEIHAKSGIISSFKSHCGGLIAPESNDNPWHYKISWNPRNVVMAGKAGADYKLHNNLVHKKYEELFNNCNTVNIEGVGNLAYYPNRDSLSYIPLYHLQNAETFLRTTLRYPQFCAGWNAIVQAGLANDKDLVAANGLSFAKWSAPVLPFVNDGNKNMLQYLGFFDENAVPSEAQTSADILQYLLETKLVMLPHDKDMIVMLHEIEYILNNVKHAVNSSLIVKGEDNLRTAMAKTVGLPLGIAAKLILNETIQLNGLHIPTIKEIYKPVLSDLEMYGIKFKETDHLLNDL